MGSGDDPAEVEQGLLGHGEVYEVWLEPIELPCKADLVQGIERELRVGAGQGGEVAGLRLPGIVGLQKDGVSVGVVDTLEVLDEPVGIPASGAAAYARVDYDMFGHRLL